MPLIAALAFTGCASAMGGPNFHTMDRDNSGCLDRTEFALSALFDEWDADRDGDVRREEFLTGMDELDVLGDWDANADDRVGPGEFGLDVQLRDYEAWDLDMDGCLNRSEYGSAHGYLVP